MQPSTSIAAIAALPDLCDRTDTVENGTVGALSDSGARMSPSGSHSSSHGVSRVSWATRWSRSSGDRASAAATRNANTQ